MKRPKDQDFTVVFSGVITVNEKTKNRATCKATEELRKIALLNKIENIRIEDVIPDFFEDD